MQGQNEQWLAQSIKQSVADWKKLFRDQKGKKYSPPEETKNHKSGFQSDPYVEEFSSRKFGTGTMEFMQLEQQLND